MLTPGDVLLARPAGSPISGAGPDPILHAGLQYRPSVADTHSMPQSTDNAVPASPEPPVGVSTRTHAGPWQEFAQRHLHDYNPAATRIWLLWASLGGLATAWSVWRLAQLPLDALVQIQLGLLMVGLAACFPVHIPRSKYSVGVADIFVFAMLILHGAPAATLAAGLEGLMACCRSSKRLSSRVLTPSAASATMLLCSVALEASRDHLVAAGGTLPVVNLALLCVLTLPYFTGTTLPLLAIVAAKTGRRLSLRQWVGDYAWMAAIYLVSAVVAGVLVMNTHQFGMAVVLVAAISIAGVVTLLKLSLNRHHAEHQAQESRIALAQLESVQNQQRFTAAFAHAAIGMAIVRPDGSIHQVNQALCSLLGCSDRELVGQAFVSLLCPGDAELFTRRNDNLHGVDAPAQSMELRCQGADGRDIWVSLHCGRFIDPADDRSGLIYQLHDISSRRQAEGELLHIAYHDTLTDLANRNCFTERLTVAVERTRLDASQRFVVMFLDLDRFKVVNDSLGHLAGNTLLREIAHRLLDVVRPGDLVARLGGDEFAVLLEHVHDPEDATALAHRLLGALSAPFAIHGAEVLPGASIGVTFSDLGYRTADEVLRDADLAMYAAKAGGRQRVALFDNSMLERIAERLKLEGELRRAIGEGQLSVAYQPLFQLEPHRLIGFEALARWVHPERGPISPAIFIGLAEESGLVEVLSAWVINEAVGQLARWHGEHPNMAHLRMNVNISGRDLANNVLVPHVRETLQRHQLPADRLTLEITETTLMGKLDVALAALHALREVGVKFSIDDFGTGYSSLAYLSTLPIDSLKIDRSFVIGMDLQPQNIEIVRAVLNLGNSLGKTVVAEGIETVEQLVTLKGLGVHVGQGYLLSRPLRADQIPALFHKAAALAL